MLKTYLASSKIFTICLKYAFTFKYSHISYIYLYLADVYIMFYLSLLCSQIMNSHYGLSDYVTFFQF